MGSTTLACCAFHSPNLLTEAGMCFAHDPPEVYLVHDVSGKVCVAESDDAILDEAPTLVEILA